jgi:hypothetical protein
MVEYVVKLRERPNLGAKAIVFGCKPLTMNFPANGYRSTGPPTGYPVVAILSLLNE